MPSSVERRRCAPLMPDAAVAAVIFFALSTFACPAGLPAKSYPLSPDSLCGSTQTCSAVLDRWNDASWTDLVDEGFDLGPDGLAAVRWYNTEGQCSGTLCNDQLQNGGGACPVLNAANSQFCGVTDELSNVLLSHAMGSNQTRYEKLHRFTARLRRPSINNLQCWMYYVNGDGFYDDWSDLCVQNDSASDASIRILGAYGIACAKQQAGVWTLGGVDYCGDYLEQGNAIWGLGTASHGEIKLLGNGEYFLANGFNNQGAAPTNGDAIRPDYYELQFLMDFAEFVGDMALRQGVIDMLEDYSISLGVNHVHRGKTGHFDSTTTTYFCDQLCGPPYMDNIETWRAVPALSGLLNVHRATLPQILLTEIYDFWWNNYAGGHPTLYGATATKPMEIYANSVDGGVRQSENTYKTMGMWIPLGAAYDADYTRQAIDNLVDIKYNDSQEQFFGAAYYAGYFSQFAQRAIGSATGMISPAFWQGAIFEDGFESANTARWSSQVP